MKLVRTDPGESRPRWIVRQLVIFVTTLLSLQVCAWTLSGVTIDGRRAAISASIVIALLGAMVWPFVVRQAIRLILITASLLVFALDAAVIASASWIVDGFSIDSISTGLLVSVILAATTGLVGSALGFDDPARQRARIVRAIGDHLRVPPTSVPGVLFIQIDGLAHDILVEAMASGHVPTMAEMVRSGSHRLVEWECDLSSQTGAMQAGIMYGDNSNMPAFPWFDKKRGRIVVCNHPHDAAEIEASRRRDSDLLTGGVSRGNVFSGGAEDSLYTFSTLGRRRTTDASLVPLFASPGALIRIVGMAVADAVREMRAARRAKRLGDLPFGERGGAYPILRAVVNVGLTEVTVAALIGDIHRGVPCAYADFVGYDEVAHHSGPRRPDALDALRRVDDRIALLRSGFASAPRPYELLILSDHGQSQGSTFRQRYGITLGALIGDLTKRSVAEPETVTEGWANVNGILAGAVDEESFSARAIRRLLHGRIESGDVEVGPNRHQRTTGTNEDIVVLASGNLGLVSFTEIEGRADLAQIERRHPGLLAALVDHPGIGFVMVRSDADRRGLVFGSGGVHHLNDGAIDGVDPLDPFGPHAAAHLARTDTFENCPDLIVNSFYDPATGEGAAFEELIGFHGGMGGEQGAPFVLAPFSLPAPAEPIVGAESLHTHLVEWSKLLHAVS